MVEEGAHYEKPRPGGEYIVEGKSGKIDVHHWHIGDDIRISLYNKEGNSVYFVTNNTGAKEWAKALSMEEDGDIAKISNDRAVADVTRIGNRYLVEAYDIFTPGHKTRVSFDEEQARHIKAVLGVEIG